MKTKLLSALYVLSATVAINVAFAQRQCSTMENLDRLNLIDPTTKLNLETIDAFTENAIAKGHLNQQKAVITIPIVVHVVYNTTAQNISVAQIQSQIDILNRDFRKTNTDANSVPSAFSSLAADCEINFCLASVDPNGVATNGITRTSTATTSFSTDDKIKNSAQGGKTAWPASKYLNLWIGNISGGTLGYAQFPGGAAATDGVVINFTAFGTGGTAAAPYNKGRTATHEVGHWLNLRHIWGDDGTACSGSDLVSDTPNQGGPNYGCPSFPSASCSNSGDMHMNYMDYVDDLCMYMFSSGQKTRMQALFVSGGSKASLLTSNGCGTPSTTPPPSSIYCSASGSDVQYEFINRVQLGTINNTSGANGGYGNFTSLSATVVKGTNYSIGLTPGFVSTAYSEYFKVYADWNNDKDFTDAGELVYTSAAVTGVVSGSFTVPTTAVTGAVRLRVMMKDAAITGPCEAFTYGEVEDYTLNIQTASTSPSCTDNYESNNTLTNAKPIAVNTSISANIGTSTDIDYFKFTNTSTNKNIRVTLSNLPADYDIVLYSSTGAQLGISDQSGTATETIVYNNGAVGTYYVKIIGYNGVFSSSSCYALLANIGSSTFKTEQENTNQVEKQNIQSLIISPNPSQNGVISVQLAGDSILGDFELTVVNATGQVVYTQKGNQQDEDSFKVGLQLENLNDGIYFVRLTNNGNQFSERLIIAN